MANVFAVGDVVRRIDNGSMGIEVGQIGTVVALHVDLTNRQFIALEGFGDTRYMSKYFELEESHPRFKVGDWVKVVSNQAQAYSTWIGTTRRISRFEQSYTGRWQVYFEEPVPPVEGEDIGCFLFDTDIELLEGRDGSKTHPVTSFKEFLESKVKV